MKSVTITLDDETAHWARLEAARRDMSVSGLIGELLEQRITGQAAYEVAMHRFMSRPPLPLKGTGRYPSRTELHDRAGLR